MGITVMSNFLAWDIRELWEVLRRFWDLRGGGRASFPSRRKLMSDFNVERVWAEVLMNLVRSRLPLQPVEDLWERVQGREQVFTPQRGQVYLDRL